MYLGKDLPVIQVCRHLSFMQTLLRRVIFSEGDHMLGIYVHFSEHERLLGATVLVDGTDLY
jgi:hypothetical protein